MQQSETTSTIEVQEKHRIDGALLQEFMEDCVEGFSGKLTIREFSYGQSNPTYMLTSGNQRYVMRRKPPGQLLKSAHAIDREYKVISALKSTNVPVPKTYAICTDVNVIGTCFYIMEYVQGRVIADIATGPYSNEDRAQIFDTANSVVAHLHNVDFEATGLSDFGKHTGYVARQIKLWSAQYEYTKTDENPYMDNLIEYLGNQVPEDDSCTIVHGDLQIANMIFDSQKNEVSAVLDWELSTLGSPLADFAYLCRFYRDSLRNIDIKSLGIPSEREYVDLYCERTGRSQISNWDFYLAFNIFKMAAIQQGIAKRVLDGTAASQQAADVGAVAYQTAKVAWAQIDKSVRID